MKRSATVKQCVTRWALGLVGVFLLAVPGTAQYNGDAANPEEIDFHRPEAWAMNYFSSVALLTGMASQVPLAKGT